MSRKFNATYPANWQEISRNIKEKYNWCCERCKRPHDPTTGHVLTVHHLDGNGMNNEDWNLACLCQRCHLHIQGKVDLFQIYMFAHSDWFKPHLMGFYKSLKLDGRI